MDAFDAFSPGLAEDGAAGDGRTFTRTMVQCGNPAITAGGRM